MKQSPLLRCSPVCLVAIITSTLVAVGVGAAHATVAQRAVCQFDLTGTTSLDQLFPLPTPPTSGVHYDLRGPVRCSGSADGQSVPTTPGTMTLAGVEGARPPQGMDTCAATDFDYTISMTWPKTPQRPAIRLRGSGTFRSLGFGAVLNGTLGGGTFLGRGGIGSDPDRLDQFGYCTPDHPYRYFALSGQLALLGSRPGGVDHQVAIFNPAGMLGLGFQYVGGGTIEAGYITPPYSYSNAGVTLYRQEVTQGDTITFTNLDTDPHTVTSCSAAACDTGAPAATVPLASQLVGTDKSTPPLPYPQRQPYFDQDVRQPGDSFTVDTAHLKAGQTYYYFCEMHPYMRGSFTINPRGSIIGR